MVEALAVATPRDRGIPFSGAMVLAILADVKKQTRRIVRPQWQPQLTTCGHWGCGVAKPKNILGVRSDAFHVHTRLADGRDKFIYCRYGISGDRLWVREAWAAERAYDKDAPRHIVRSKVWYFADGPAPKWAGRRRPSMFMPRWAARLSLEITDIRCERLQSISEADAKLEGVTPLLNQEGKIGGYAYRLGLAVGWDELHGKGSWASSPWVWVIGFRRLP